MMEQEGRGEAERVIGARLLQASGAVCIVCTAGLFACCRLLYVVLTVDDISCLATSLMSIGTIY